MAIQVKVLPTGQRILFLCLGLCLLQYATLLLILWTAVAISAEHSFFIRHDKSSREAYAIACQEFAESPQQEAVSLAVEGIDLKKSSLEELEDIDKWGMETLHALVEIARENRLGTAQ